MNANPGKMSPDHIKDNEKVFHIPYQSSETGPACTPSTKEPVVHVAVRTLSENVDALHEYLSALEDRLVPVLNPPARQAGEEQGPARESSSLVEKLLALAAGVASATNRVNGLIDRLQI